MPVANATEALVANTPFTRTGIAGTEIASLTTGRGWINYSPADPFAGYTVDTAAAAYKTVSADLTRIKTQGFEGIVTYGTDPNLITGAVPQIASGLGLKVIAGVFWSSNADMIRQIDFLVGSVAPNGWAQGYVVGNETLNKNGENITNLASEMAFLKEKTGKPVTTAEIVDNYVANVPTFPPEDVVKHLGDLTTQSRQMLLLGDWVAPNIQAFYDGYVASQNWDPTVGAAVASNIFKAIRLLANALDPNVAVVAHEYWWPHAGHAGASPENVVTFFKLSASSSTYNQGGKLVFVWGEGVDQPWKDPGQLGVERFFGYWDKDGNAVTGGGQTPIIDLQPYYKAAGTQNRRLATAAGPGGGPQVNVYDGTTGALLYGFLAFDASFSGGVRVAVGDVNADGIDDIVAGAGPGGGPQVRVFDGKTGQPLDGPLGSFFGLAASFTGGVYVAVGDVNGDGFDDVIVGADAGGGPQVSVFSGKTGTLLTSFFAFAPSFSGGVRVAADDINGDGMADIIVGAGPGALPQITVFSGADLSVLLSFFAFPGSFAGGVFVAAGDVNADSKSDIIAGAGAGGGPQVAVFSATNGSLLKSFFAFPPTFSSGVRVATSDRDGDGTADIVVGAGPGGGPQVSVYQFIDLTLLDSAFAFAPGFRGGVFVGR